MYPKLIRIPIDNLGGDASWIILILAAIFTLVFYYLGNNEKKESKDKKSILYWIFNVLFYSSLLILLIISLTLLTNQKSLDFNSYGFMLAIAFILGVYLFLKKAKQENIPEEPLLDLGLWGILVAMIGARLFFMLFEYSFIDNGKSIESPLAFLANPSAFFTEISEGGLVAYGGFICGILFAILFVKKKKLPMGKVADIATPSLALGVGFARLGCNFAGCCFGNLTEDNHLLSISLSWFKQRIIPFVYNETLTNPTYENFKSHFANADSTFIWPAQLISAVNGFIMFAVLQFIYVKYQKNFKFNGLLFYIFIMYYSLTRFLIEFIRIDTPKEFYSLSAAQFIGIFVMLLAIILLVYNWNRANKLKVN